MRPFPLSRNRVAGGRCRPSADVRNASDTDRIAAPQRTAGLGHVWTAPAVSYAEWDNEESIRAYLKSADHQEIKRHNTNITGAKVVVKEYDIVR
jgi:hypothetical protein